MQSGFPFRGKLSQSDSTNTRRERGKQWILSKQIHTHAWTVQNISLLTVAKREKLRTLKKPKGSQKGNINKQTSKQSTQKETSGHTNKLRAKGRNDTLELDL